MGKVYVLIDGGHDYSAAEEFGEIVRLNLPASSAYDTSKAFALLSEGLRSVDLEDFLIISGPATLCCIATAIFIERLGQVSFLLFSDGKYLPKTVCTIGIHSED